MSSESTSDSSFYKSESRSPPPPSNLCSSCGSEILDNYLLRTSPDVQFHAACMKCSECGEVLDETKTCFLRNNKLFCKLDYARSFTKCMVCYCDIVGKDMVIKTSDSIYHLNCFKCSSCNKALQKDDLFSYKGNKIYCQIHHEKDVKTLDLKKQHKTTRMRTVFDDRQQHVLKTFYVTNPRPDALMKEKLSKMTGLKTKVISVWFQNNRCKDKITNSRASN